MGTLVFKPDSRDRHFTIIDGQQRLATFTIILTVLRKLTNEYAPAKYKEIEKRLLIKGNPRFKPSLHDHDAFARLLENAEGLQKVRHKQVKAGYDFFYDGIQNYIENTKGKKRSHFGKFLKTVLTRMVFVEIVLTGDDDAHAIFESINYAGVPLTQADLARNFILSLVRNGKEQQRLNNAYWRPIEDKIEESISGSNVRDRKAEFQKTLRDFLRAFLVVEKRKYISTTDLFRELRSYFCAGHVEDKLKKLFKEAEKYCKFINPKLEDREKLRSQLQRLADLKMTTYYPVLLVLYRSLANEEITSKELEQAMRYIESFVVRRAFNSKVSRDLNQVFAMIAVKLIDKKGKNIAKILRDEKWHGDEHFKTCFVSSPIYTTAPATAKFALESIERYKSADKELQIAKSQIEHVFPQQAEMDDWDSDALSDLKKNLHVMGNLTLTAYNTKLSNHGFKEKKKVYKKSPYWLTKIIAKHDTWTKAEIEKRGVRLLRVAMKIWHGCRV
ncbi:MAG: DUF262 domain-containing protein [Nitrospirae bacterium]|nr:DUF262 domain-containing protein [Nitrospirota bacterium]MBI3377434.1 DUF262 domain-containing protein [Nitrospirota bacterium]